MKVRISPLFQEASPPHGPGLENLPGMSRPVNMSKSASSSVKWV